MLFRMLVALGKGKMKVMVGSRTNPRGKTERRGQPELNEMKVVELCVGKIYRSSPSKLVEANCSQMGEEKELQAHLVPGWSLVGTRKRICLRLLWSWNLSQTQ